MPNNPECCGPKPCDPNRVHPCGIQVGPGGPVEGLALKSVEESSLMDSEKARIEGTRKNKGAFLAWPFSSLFFFKIN